MGPCLRDTRGMAQFAGHQIRAATRDATAGVALFLISVEIPLVWCAGISAEGSFIHGRK